MGEEVEFFFLLIGEPDVEKKTRSHSRIPTSDRRQEPPRARGRERGGGPAAAAVQARGQERGEHGVVERLIEKSGVLRLCLVRIQNETKERKEERKTDVGKLLCRSRRARLPMPARGPVSRIRTKATCHGELATEATARRATEEEEGEVAEEEEQEARRSCRRRRRCLAANTPLSPHLLSLRRPSRLCLRLPRRRRSG